MRKILKADPEKLDLGCGNNLQPGFTGVDLIGKPDTQADITHNLFFDFPWPFKDNSIKEVFASHVLEHVPHGNGSNDPLFQFMDEIYRILKPGGIARFICPYYTSVRAFQDPTHLRFISEPMFFYFNKQWRELNKLTHYPVKCNFDIIKQDHAISEEYTGRAQDAVAQAAMHFWNVVMDLQITLRKPKKV